MTSELRPAVECELCAKRTPDMEQTAARMAAQIGGVMQCRECGRVYETQAAELAKWKALSETLAGALEAFMPTHINLRMPHPSDDYALPLDVNMGELRALDKALTSYKEQRDAS